MKRNSAMTHGTRLARDLIQELLATNQYSKQKLADLIGISQAGLNGIIKGKPANIRPRTMSKILRFYAGNINFNESKFIQGWSDEK